MNPADGWRQSPLRRCRRRSLNPVSWTLAGGKAPVYWQRDLRRIQAWQDFLWRNGAWVDAIASINLNLRDQPLLGQCLLALIEPVTRATEPHLESSRTQPIPSTWQSPKLHSDITPAPNSNRRQSRDAALDAGTPRSGDWDHKNVPVSPNSHPGLTKTSIEESSFRHPVAIVLQQSPQVSQQLLSRLAGKTGSTKVTQSLDSSSSHVQQPGIRQNWLSDWQDNTRETMHQEEINPSAQSPLPLNTEAAIVNRLRRLSNKNNLNTRLNQSLSQPTGEPSAATSSSLLPNQALHQNWLLGLIQRTRRCLEPEKFDPVFKPQLATPNQLALSATLSLAQQCSISVLGQTAHLELLTRLVDTTVAQNNSSSHGAKETSGSRQTPFTRSLDLLSIANLEKTPHNQTFAPALTESELVVLPTAGVSQRTNSLVELPAQIAPTIGMSSLPPMLPPQMVHLPIPSVANAMIRQEAKEAKQEETATTEDDLNVLAAKIKRILDEEARRYGIDV